MSAPRCAVCHDSGSKNQTGDYLDCPACDMPHTRKALNDFVKSLGPTHPEDVALAIHQRALAMAPKQEAQTESLPEMTDDLIFQWAEGYVFTLKGMPHKMTFSRPRFVAAVRTIIAHLPAPVAALAAANGALTDAQVHQGVMALLGCTSSEVEDYSAKLYEGYANDVRRVHATLAAAGPDAALIECTHEMLCAAMKAAVATKIITSHADEETYLRNWSSMKIVINAALSGAKGN